MVRSGFVAVALLAAGMLPAAATGEFKSGSWSGAAYMNDGKFSSCIMSAPFINRWDLVFAVGRDGYFSLLLRSPDLDVSGNLLSGSKIALRLQIDDSPVIIRPFTPAAKNALVTKFATDLDFVARLSTGKVLRVNTTTRVRRFPLTGLKDALGLLHACAAKYRKA